MKKRVMKGTLLVMIAALIFSMMPLTVSAATKDKSVLRKAAMTAIPEFKRFNIIENEVRDVI